MCPAYCGRHHFGMHQAACTQATVARNNCRHRAAYTQPTMADSTCLGRTTCTDSTRVHRAAAPNIQWQTVLACTELHVQTAHACTELHVQKVQCSRFDPLQGLFPGPVLVNSNFVHLLKHVQNSSTPLPGEVGDRAVAPNTRSIPRTRGD